MVRKYRRATDSVSTGTTGHSFLHPSPVRTSQHSTLHYGYSNMSVTRTLNSVLLRTKQAASWPKTAHSRFCPQANPTLPLVFDFHPASIIMILTPLIYTCLVNVKWNKDLFKDVEVDLNAGAAAFRQQLFSLSNVAPENQKGTNHQILNSSRLKRWRNHEFSGIEPRNLAQKAAHILSDIFSTSVLIPSLLLLGPLAYPLNICFLCEYSDGQGRSSQGHRLGRLQKGSRPWDHLDDDGHPLPNYRCHHRD